MGVTTVLGGARRGKLPLVALVEREVPELVPLRATLRLVVAHGDALASAVVLATASPQKYITPKKF